MEANTKPLNTVNTVLSQDGADHLACILHWFWDEIAYDSLTADLMALLAVYVKHCPADAHLMRRPDNITLFVSGLIQLRDQLTRVVDFEEPWNWVSTHHGWALRAETNE